MLNDPANKQASLTTSAPLLVMAPDMVIVCDPDIVSPAQVMPNAPEKIVDVVLVSVSAAAASASASVQVNVVVPPISTTPRFFPLLVKVPAAIIRNRPAPARVNPVVVHVMLPLTLMLKVLVSVLV
jgi:hypothetical protein